MADAMRAAHVKRLRDRLGSGAPPVLFGSGPAGLLTGGVAARAEVQPSIARSANPGPEFKLEKVPTPGGVWAPTIRYRDGVFYVIFDGQLVDARERHRARHQQRGPQ